MIFNRLHVPSEPVARMQDRRMPVGKPCAVVEMAAGEFAEPVEARLDVAEQRIRQMNAQEIGQCRIGAVEVHTGGIGRQEPRPIGTGGNVAFDGLIHIQIASFVSALSCRFG
jgi:hypothetical protein